MVVDPCTLPTVTCNQWVLLSPDQQKWYLIQLLNYLNGALGGTQYSLSALKTASDGWICQGSPAKIAEQWMVIIGANTLGGALDTSQPICWTPLELEGALAYIICKALSNAGGLR